MRLQKAVEDSFQEVLIQQLPFPTKKMNEKENPLQNQLEE